MTSRIYRLEVYIDILQLNETHTDVEIVVEVCKRVMELMDSKMISYHCTFELRDFFVLFSCD